MVNRKISINRGDPEETPPGYTTSQPASTARASSSFVVVLRVLLIAVTVIGLLYLMSTLIRYSQRSTQPTDNPDDIASEDAKNTDVGKPSVANSETSDRMAAPSGGGTGNEAVPESGTGQNEGKSESSTPTPTSASSGHDHPPAAKVNYATQRRAVQQAVNEYQDENDSAGDGSVYLRILTHLRQEVRLLLVLLDEDMPSKTQELVKEVMADLPNDDLSWGWIPPASRCVTELTLTLIHGKLGDVRARQLIGNERQALLVSDSSSFPECLYLHAEIIARAWSAGADAVQGGSGRYDSTNRRIEDVAQLPGLQHASASIAISQEALVNYVGQGAGVDSVCRSALARRNQATTALGRAECNLEARARTLSLARF
jgi:hypothetical protein